MATTPPDTSGMTQSAADFQKATEVAFQAQMVVANAQLVHEVQSAVAKASGDLGKTVGQDIRASARPN